jgi:uncharacterized protein YjeT (DUF2065 family)
MSLAIGLIRASVAVFAVTGLGYLLAPGAMLSVVGVPSTGTSDFLLRTEGVALVSGGTFLWAVRKGTEAQLRLVLYALAAYYVVGSIVDVAAFAQGIVGLASVLSAALRIAVGGLCLAAGWRVSTD